MKNTTKTTTTPIDGYLAVSGSALIAQFMGETVRKDGKLALKSPEPLTGHCIVDAKYESSWDWLMPVVEKIETIKIEGYNINFSIMDKTAHWTPAHWGGLKAYLSTSKIEAVYMAVVAFIEWWNQADR
jgi:hypothetical protein